MSVCDKPTLKYYADRWVAGVEGGSDYEINNKVHDDCEDVNDDEDGNDDADNDNDDDDDDDDNNDDNDNDAKCVFAQPSLHTSAESV
jgi:hypothetical protein